MKRVIALVMSVLMLISCVTILTSCAPVSTTSSIVSGDNMQELVDQGLVSFENEDDEEGFVQNQSVISDVSDAESDDEEAKPDYDYAEQLISGTYKGHTVTVEGMIPKGSTLSLSEVSDKDAQTITKKMGGEDTVFACDIKIIDPYGNEWQPPEDRVTVSVSNLSVDEGKKLNFYHISEDIDSVVKKRNISKSVATVDFVSLDLDGKAEFETGSFSTFIGFTVDFHYNGKTISIAGYDSILLSELFAKLQIIKETENVTNVEFTDTSLVSVTKQGEDWLLTSHESFLSEEKLTVTFADGEVLTIKVTDAIGDAGTTTREQWGGGTKSGFNVEKGAIVIIYVTNNFTLSSTINVQSGGELRFYLATAGNCGSNATIWQANGQAAVQVSAHGKLTIRNDWFTSDTSTTTTNFPASGNRPKKDAATEDISGCIRFDRRTTNNHSTSTTLDNVTDVTYAGSEPVIYYTNSDAASGTSAQALTLRGVVFQNMRGSTTTSIVVKSKATCIIVAKDLTNITIRNCLFDTIKNNADDGEGIIKFRSTTTTSGSVTLQNCKFTDISVAHNYGIAAFYGTSFEKDFVIKGNTFTNVSAKQTGGFLIGGNYADDDAPPTYTKLKGALSITDNTFTNCKATTSSYGAIQLNCVVTGDTMITDNKFNTCTAKVDVGALGLTENTNIKGTLKLYRNTFTDCSAGTDYGAVRFNSKIHQTEYDIRSNTFKNCHAGNVAGAVGFTTNTSVGQIIFADNTFTHCTSNNSYGAIRMGAIGTTATFARNTFSNCSAGTGKSTSKGYEITKQANCGAIGFTGYDSDNGTRASNFVTVNFRGNTFYKCLATKSYGAVGVFGVIGTLTFGKDTDSSGVVRYDVFKSCYAGYVPVQATNSFSPQEPIVDSIVSGTPTDDDKIGNAGAIGLAEGASVGSFTITGFANNTESGFSDSAYTSSTQYSSYKHTFQDCMATKNGGCIYINTQTNPVTIQNIRIRNGWARNGSAVYISSTSVLPNFTMKNSAILHCNNLQLRNNLVGEAGGTFRTTGGAAMKATIRNCLFYKNISNQNGGGIYWNAAGVSETSGMVVDRSHLLVTGCTFDSNTAHVAGGAIFNETFMDINSSTLIRNSARRGGGISQQTYSNADVIKFNAPNQNGTIVGEYANKSSNLIIGSNVTIEQNTAVERGGGVTIDANFSTIVYKRLTEETRRDFEIKFEIPASSANVKIINNTSLGDGGGISYNTKFYSNSPDFGTWAPNVEATAAQQQAYVDVYRKYVVISAGEIRDNHAYNNGGGIYADGKNAEVTVNGGKIYANSAGCVITNEVPPTVANHTKKEGRVWYSLVNNKNEAFTNTGITNGTSETVNPYELYYTYKDVDGSQSGDGGGIYVSGEGTKFTMNGGEIGKINETALADPGANASQEAIDEFEESLHYYGNKADFGGGVAVKGGNITLNETTSSKPIIKYNSAVSGAGLMAFDDGDVTMTGGEISNNHAEGKYTLLAGATAPENSRYIGCGGGVYADGGIVTINEGKIDTNYATDGGGAGVFVARGGDVIFNGGFITNNVCNISANYTQNKTTAHGIGQNFTGYGGIGGGICLADGYADKLSTFSIKQVEAQKLPMGIYRNTATFAADDVFASGVYTKLDVPDLEEMDTSGYGEITPAGWYEDYPNRDTSYSAGLGMDSVEASRYRADVDIHQRKHRFETVDPVTANNYIAVNSENQYVCMTLGITTMGNLTITLAVKDEKGNEINAYDDTEYVFKLMRCNPDGSGEMDITSEGDAKNFEFEKTSAFGAVSTLTPGGEFTMVPGDTLSFTKIPSGNYKILHIKDGKPYKAYVVSTSHTGTDSSTGVEMGLSGTEKTSAVKVGDGSVVKVNYVNVIKSLRVTVNYYDRKLVNGQPNDISDTPTSFTKIFAAKDFIKYAQADSNGVFVAGSLQIDDMVNNTADSTALTKGNVIDNYIIWGSQKEATTAMGDLITSNKFVKAKYTSSTSAYRANQYGVPVNGENWVTYYKANGTTSPYRIPAQDQEITDVTVWLMNTPKEYKVTGYTADTVAGLTQQGDVYVANTNTTNLTAYYNQRIGYSKGGNQDSVTNHLQNYSLGGYINAFLLTSNEIKNGSTVYTFSHWSNEPNGSTIVSTDIHYNYRITSDITLYAVYKQGEVETVKGLTVTKNNPDVYLDSNGTTKIRLNTMMNVYGCEDSDHNIKNVAAVYVLDRYGNDASQNLKLESAEALSQIRSLIAANLPGLSSDGKLTGGIGIGKDANGNYVVASGSDMLAQANYYVYFVDSWGDGTTPNGDTNLTNKNRNEFSLSFTASTMANKRILAFAAMNYEGMGWVVSDNFIDYTFDGNGLVS